jgi:hypothetical protein
VAWTFLLLVKRISRIKPEYVVVNFCIRPRAGPAEARISGRALIEASVGGLPIIRSLAPPGAGRRIEWGATRLISVRACSDIAGRQ